MVSKPRRAHRKPETVGARYETALGRAYCADAIEVLRAVPSGSVQLVLTSPPYALHFKKEYGNADQREYVDWISPYCREIKRVLKPDGSFVLNIGGAWTPGEPTRSLYHLRVLLHLCDDLEFRLCQDMFWFNPAKMPAPAEWVNVRRIRVKDSVEYIYWLGKTAHPKADNAKVLQEYSADMRRLINRGVKPTTRPSGHQIKETFSRDRGGSIPPNFLQCGNNESNSAYIKGMKAQGRKIHPARFPAELPRFFIEFLTDPGDLVIDPFAGSNTTGAVAESLGRRWIASELRSDYVDDSRIRFEAEMDFEASGTGRPPRPRQLRLIG
jgi:site-specific DNA-methyltransferase (cytosine-N4-specific)